MDTRAATDAIGSLAIYCGLFAAVIQLVDWLLPQKATSAMSDALLHIWFWLAEQRVGRRLLLLVHNSTVLRTILFGLCITPLLVVALVVRDVIGGPIVVPEAVLFVYGFLPGASLAFGILAVAAYSRVSRLVGWIVGKNTASSTLIRLAALCALGILALGLLVWLMVRTGGRLPALQAVLAFFGLGFFGAPTLALTVAVLAMVAWLLVLGLVTIVLGVSEFIVRRLAEYPKGPVLGASALLAALGGLLKGLS